MGKERPGDPVLMRSGGRLHPAGLEPAGWLYLVPDFNWLGYRDARGVLHAFQADGARYNRSTNDFQVLINGRWLSVGRDVDQLMDGN